MLSSKTLPGSSLRARSLTAPPHSTVSPIPAARDLARRLDPPPFPLPFPSLPFPLPSLRPLPIYLSTYPPLYLPLYLSTYLSIYLPLYLSTYPPPACPPLPALPRPAPGPVYQLPLPIPFPRPFFFPLLAPSPPRSKPRFFFFFFLFYANQARYEPVTSLFANSLPIQCLFPFCYPGSVTNSMVFLYVIHMQIKFLPLIGC